MPSHLNSFFLNGSPFFFCFFNMFVNPSTFLITCCYCLPPFVFFACFVFSLFFSFLSSLFAQNTAISLCFQCVILCLLTLLIFIFIFILFIVIFFVFLLTFSFYFLLFLSLCFLSFCLRFSGLLSFFFVAEPFCCFSLCTLFPKTTTCSVLFSSLSANPFFNLLCFFFFLFAFFIFVFF